MLITLSHCVSSQFPPLIAAKSIIAEPGFILSTISLSISIGAGLSGINAVDITNIHIFNCFFN